MNSGVAFNSQRLHEACKAKGVLELHLLQKEAAQLKTQYQSSVPVDEMAVRQIQHTQFHVKPEHLQQISYQSTGKHQNSLPINTESYYNKAGDLAAPYLNLFKENPIKQDALTAIQQQSSVGLQKPPLQQQLMQHRLLQQKRQILQKQGALEASLSRRQMFRQHSYKIAQQTPVLPPLPLNENEAEDLLAFQTIVEGTRANGSPTPSATGSPKMMKTSHIVQPTSSCNMQNLSPDCTWNALPNSMQTCQISEGSITSADSWSHSPLYQVYNNYN